MICKCDKEGQAGQGPVIAWNRVSSLLAAVGCRGCTGCALELSCGVPAAAGLAPSVFLGQASAVALSTNDRSPA
jgi:hypothetical protein